MDMRKILFALFIGLLFYASPMQAQKSIEGKYDSKTYLFITNDSTYWIDFFQGDRARISSNGLFGFMDTTGKILCEPKYDLIYDFQNGLAITNIGDKLGIINAKGKELIAPQYESLAFLKDDIFVVSIYNEGRALIRSNGEVLIAPEYYIIFSINKDGRLIYHDTNAEQIGFIDEKTWRKIPVLKGKYLYKSIKELDLSITYSIDTDLFALECRMYYKNKKEPYDDIEMLNPILEYNDGLTINMECIDSTCLFGFIDRDLKPRIKAEYSWVNAFKNGYASVFKNEKCGIIDTSGKIIIPIAFEYIEVLDNAHFIVRKEDKYGVVDKNNKVIIPIKHNYLFYTENDLYAVYNGQKWGVINEKGALVLPYEYDAIANNLAIKINNIFPFPQTTSSVHINAYYKGYYFDRNGLLNKDFVEMMKYFVDRLDFNVRSANLKYYTITKYTDSSTYNISAPINEQFKIIGKHSGPCGDGIYNISQCFLKGIMNADDEIIVPLLYNDIEAVKIDTAAIVKLQTSANWHYWHYWDYIHEWKKNYIEENKRLSQYNSNLFVVNSPNCKYGIIDINHKMILNLEYDYIEINKGKIIAYKYLEERKVDSDIMPLNILEDRYAELRLQGKSIYGNCFHDTSIDQEYAVFDFRGKMIEPFKPFEKQ